MPGSAFKMSYALALLVLLSRTGSVYSAESASLTRRDSPVIDVATNGWGASSVQDVEKVLASTAHEFLAFFPDNALKSIRVRHVEEGPKILYERGLKGEHIILLDSEDKHWAQLAYQFSHELCHGLSNYDSEDKGKESPNQWFAEVLCETASLFTLRRMAVTWQSSPPYPNWKEYAPALKEYADGKLNGKQSQLPAGVSLEDWYRANENLLRSNPCLRELNDVAANLLLPLFEKEPEHWPAIRYLNLGKRDNTKSFRQYVQEWHLHSPQKHQVFVEKVARLFDMQLSP